MSLFCGREMAEATINLHGHLLPFIQDNHSFVSSPKKKGPFSFSLKKRTSSFIFKSADANAMAQYTVSKETLIYGAHLADWPLPFVFPTNMRVALLATPPRWHHSSCLNLDSCGAWNSQAKTIWAFCISRRYSCAENMITNASPPQFNSAKGQFRKNGVVERKLCSKLRWIVTDNAYLFSLNQKAALTLLC